jgi:hypothetical protein
MAGLDPMTNRPFPIRVGLLHSLTGPMAISESPLIDAAMLAIREINARGGVLGRPLEAIIEDGASDENMFRQKASKLVDEHGVSTVFGCWTSASRKAVLPVFEERNHLLWYPDLRGDQLWLFAQRARLLWMTGRGLQIVCCIVLARRCRVGVEADDARRTVPTPAPVLRRSYAS